jgi:hypothetical protein
MEGGVRAAPNGSWSGLSRECKEVKRLGREADHSSSSSTDDKSEWNCRLLFPYGVVVWCLIEEMSNCTCLLFVLSSSSSVQFVFTIFLQRVFIISFLLCNGYTELYSGPEWSRRLWSLSWRRTYNSVERDTFLCKEDIMNLIMHFSCHRLPRFRRCSCAQHLLLRVLFSYGERASFTFL